MSPATAQRFDFDWETRYRVAALPFGITPSRAWVEVDDTDLTVRFGWWTLRSPLANITATSTTGSYAFAKTAGPPHLSFADRGVTFATNGRRGLCLQLDEPVAGIDPTGRIVHPGVTLTVADLPGLEAAVASGR